DQSCMDAHPALVFILTVPRNLHPKYTDLTHSSRNKIIERRHEMRALLTFGMLLAGIFQCSATQAKLRPAARKPVRKKPARRGVKPAPPVDPTEGDNVDGDDLTIRRAAVEAIGTMNGSVVVVDPANGRVLTMVNQKLALKSGFIPCSTIKLVTAVAAL